VDDIIKINKKKYIDFWITYLVVQLNLFCVVKSVMPQVYCPWIIMKYYKKKKNNNNNPNKYTRNHTHTHAHTCARWSDIKRQRRSTAVERTQCPSVRSYTRCNIKLIDCNVEESTTTVPETRLRFTQGVQYFKSENNILFYLLGVTRT